MQVALSINARNETDARDLVRHAARIVPQGGIVHIDIGDGIYTPNTTWDDAVAWRAMAPAGIKTEVHLMARDWEARLVPWLEAGAFRVIIHISLASVNEAKRAREVAARYGAELMLSISLADDVVDALAYADFASFQILAVLAGRSGQVFNESAIKKIKDLRAAFPNAILEVDGGITPLIVARAKEAGSPRGGAGADIVVSSSYIWNADNPKEAYEKLVSL